MSGTSLCETCGEPLSANERAQEFRVHIACIPATQRLISLGVVRGR